MDHSKSAHDILQYVGEWEQKLHPQKPMPEADARRKLHKARMSDAEIDGKVARLKIGEGPSSARVLASYPDLQGLDRLDEADFGFDLQHNPKAAMLRAVFQAAEVAVLNLQSLATRATADIKAGRLEDAADKCAWMHSFQETLTKLSQLPPKLMGDTGDGASLSLQHSPHLAAYTEGMEQFHGALKQAGLVAADCIGHHGLHVAGRRMTFGAFTDANYERIWKMGLGSVRLPALEGAKGMDERELYRKFIGADAIHSAVFEVQQRDDNFLTQFRAYHQMSEIFAKAVNRILAANIKKTLTQDTSLAEIHEDLYNSTQLISVVHQNVNPILRNLVPERYQNIRGSLGITSGSHSPNIRHGLFHLYAPLVNAVKLRVMDGRETYTDQELRDTVQTLRAQRNSDPDANHKNWILQHTLDIHHYIRGWREEHIQYILTQLGISPQDTTPIASISGSVNALVSAHAMVETAHGKAKDPIVPIYETLLRRDYPDVPSYEEAFQGTAVPQFVKDMGHATALMASRESSQVQARVHSKLH